MKIKGKKKILIISNGRRKAGSRKKSWVHIEERTGVASSSNLLYLARDRGQYAKLVANLH